jgi:hypothetical protein
MEKISMKGITLSKEALNNMNKRGINEGEQQVFKEILGRYQKEKTNKSSKEFLTSLNREELEILCQAHGLVKEASIDIKAGRVDQEGAINLLMEPKSSYDYKDINNDGLITTGTAHTFSFPPANAPKKVFKAWEDATKDMTIGEKMIAIAPFLVEYTTANIRKDSNGNYHHYMPGEEGYINIFAQPNFSYQSVINKHLKRLENVTIGKDITWEAYTIEKNFLNKFKASLEKYNVK